MRDSSQSRVNMRRRLATAGLHAARYTKYIPTRLREQRFAASFHRFPKNLRKPSFESLRTDLASTRFKTAEDHLPPLRVSLLVALII